MNCTEAVHEINKWVILTATVPMAINLASLVLIVLTVMQIKNIKGVTESITSSTHWLTRMAVRVGIGPTAKKALVDYARSKPELAMLVPAAAPDKKNN